MITLTVALALWAMAPEIVYQPGAAFTRYEPKDRPCVATDAANLRSQPNADGKATSTLALGTVVEIVEVGSQPARVRDREDVWYRVKVGEQSGFVFGNVLTPLCPQRDVNGDGRLDQLTVAWTSNGRLRVRASTQADGAQIASTDVAVPTRGAGGRAVLFDVPALPGKRQQAVGVRACAGATCVSSLVVGERDMIATLLLTRQKDATMKVAGAQVTLGDAAATVGAWPLVVCPGCGAPPTPWSSMKVSRVATVPFDGELEFAGECELIGSVEDGKLSGSDILSCRPGEEPCKGEGCPDPPLRTVLVRTGKGRASVVQQGDQFDAVTSGLAAAGITVGKERAPPLVGVPLPAALFESASGAVRVRGSWEIQQPLGAVLFAHRDLGPVRAVPGSTAVVAVDGPAHVVADATPPAPSRMTITPDLGCGPMEAIVVEATDLDGDGQHLNKKALRRLASLLSDNSGADSAEGAVLRSFERRPPITVPDTFGRRVVAFEGVPTRECLAEPLLYLSSDAPVDVVVRFGAPLTVVHTDPPLVDHAWQVRVHGQHPPLFWDGVSPEHWPSTLVERVPGAELHTALLRLASDAGFTAREADDFADAWARRGASAPLVEIGVVDREALDALAPVHITPTPDVNIRLAVVLTLRRQPSPTVAVPQRRAAPSRHGFVAAEWGGVLVDLTTSNP